MGRAKGSVLGVDDVEYYCVELVASEVARSNVICGGVPVDLLGGITPRINRLGSWHF